MQKIKTLADINLYKSRIFSEYFEGLSLCFLDIETTGLYPNSSEIILGGLLLPGSPDGTKSQIIQYFGNGKKDEAELLRAYLTILSNIDVLITYNGRRFDLPFLKYRLTKHRIDNNLDSLQVFDLYRVLNNYSKMRDVIPNLKQKSIENYLGLSPLREDSISGEESIELYNDYLRTGSKAAFDKILLHNKDDLIQLASIMRILERLDLHKILYHEGFTIAVSDKIITVNSIEMKKGILTVKGRTRNINLDYYSFETGYHAVHHKKSGELILTLPFEKSRHGEYLDLEAFQIDFSDLKKYPAFESGFLILKDGDNVNFAEINKMLKIILTEILEKLML